MAKFIVFMADGTKQLASSAELEAIDARDKESVEAGTGHIYNGSRDAELPRFTVDKSLAGGDEDGVVIKIVDTYNGDEVLDDPETGAPWTSSAKAKEHAEALNQTLPTVAQMFGDTGGKL
jgi:hypothetical protein